MRLGDRNPRFKQGSVNSAGPPPAGSVENVAISNIQAVNAGRRHGGVRRRRARTESAAVEVHHWKQPSQANETAVGSFELSGVQVNL
jgi:hypothetical protein